MLPHNRNTAESLGDRRLQRAHQHVSALWFPPNPQLLSRIKDGLQSGAYDLDISFLFSELRTDFALFTFCLRELARSLKEDQVTIPPGCRPYALFELAGLDRIKKVLSVDSERISAHVPDDMSEDQALRLQFAMISASTAEVLSQEKEIDSELGFSCALLRQLGYTLIAWNYPSVYQRCLASLQSKKDFDLVLTEALGFSPQLLALSIVGEWGLSSEINGALADIESNPKEIAGTLSKICEIGEALARANDPEHYPSAAKDWDLVKSEVESTIGFDGMKLIQDRVRQNCENYVALLPEMFAQVENINPDTQIHQFLENSLFRNNQFVKHCPPRLRKKFKDLYALIQPGAVSKEGLQLLLKEVVPFAGFNGGYVYTLDPGTMALVPRTKVGLVIAKRMEPVPYENGSAHSDPILTAYGCSAPIVQMIEQDCGPQPLAFMAGALGSEKKIGVLYLELPEELLNDKDANMLLNYKAIRQALNDCLNS
ncbi:MAG: HDOD domain-containing protein [Deltaproteobacteria bacterium]|nr:HDOD domain-containing protein [Deltaproteobacteria bacterium]